MGNRAVEDVDKALPEAVETEEELDGFGPGEGLHWAESAMAVRALEGIDGPGGFDEVAPERAHGAGGGFSGGGALRASFTRAGCFAARRPKGGIGGWFSGS